MRRWWACFALALLPQPAVAARHPDAQVSLEVLIAARPGLLPEAAPTRFLLLDDRRVFVGGSSELAATRLEKSETKPIEKLVDKVHKLPGLGSAVRLGPGETQYRLWLRRGELEIVASGDPAGAARELRPLAELLERLEAFNHASLMPVAPTGYLLSARLQSLDGGCRPWTLPAALADVLAVPRLIGVEAAAGWPTGAIAASVCAGDKRYAVGLRPLISGERP